MSQHHTATPALLHSLATLLRLRGKVVSFAFLRSRLTGSSQVHACIHAAEQAGLQSSLVSRPRLGDISPLALPCVLLLKDNTSCVLTAITAEDADVILPEHDVVPIHIPREKLEEHYAGHAIFGILETRLDTRTQHVDFVPKKRWFWDVIAYYAPIYRHTVFASIIINCIAVLSPLFVMNVYDRVVPNKALETLWVLAIGIGVAYIFDALLRLARSHFVDTAGRNADVILSGRLLEKVLHMRLEARPDSTGALVNNLREFESLREFFSSSTLLACIDLPFLFLFLIIMAFIGGPLVLLPLFAMPLLLITGLCIQRMAEKTAQKSYKHAMHKNALLVEMVHGLETIKGCQAEHRMQEVWEALCGLSAQSSTQNKWYATLAVTFATFITHAVTVSMTVWGVYCIADGSLTMGGLIGCNILVGRAMAPLLQMAQLLTRLQHSRISLKALDVIMQIPSENTQSDGVDFSTLTQSFSCHECTFSYPASERLALDAINLTLKQGEKLGIVGAMGSGKSTLGKLFMGFYTPTKGSITLGNVDMRQIATADIRGYMGYLPQDIVLFYGTVRDNITMGDPLITDAMLARAADIAGVTAFMRHFPAGFATQVGEQGRALSGGQRQAIALARTLVRDPDILILDEPTSNMDIHTESLVQKNLSQYIASKTFICISHRPSMLRMVDRIIVMDQGCIRMDGPREEILQALGLASKPAPPVSTIEGNIADALRQRLQEHALQRHGKGLV